MEECETLCTRVAIMVNGRLKCLGSTQHLKSKFGSGFTLVVKMLPRSCDAFVEMLNSTFPGVTLKDAHQGTLHLHIADSSLRWSQLFHVMEKVKDKFEVDDYALSQTTLEQVFLAFARTQVAPTRQTRSCCSRVTCGLC